MTTAAESGRQLQDHEIATLKKHPEYVGRMRTLTVITGSMFMAAVMYVGIILSGVLDPSRENAAGSNPIVWQALIGVAVALIPVTAIIARIQLRSLESARDFTEASARASVMTILALAFGEAIVVFGLVSYILGGPVAVVYGLMALGIAMMAVVTAILHPHVTTAMLRHLPLPTY